MLSTAPRRSTLGGEHGAWLSMVVLKNEVAHAWDLKFISKPKSQNPVPPNLSVNEVVLSAFLDQNVFLLKYD